MSRIRSIRPALLLLLTIGATLATAQDLGRRTGSREQMWPAPTAEDWKRPVLITFQRTWEDAVAVSKETGKPILICVNMDGEVASEHYAGIRYRQPEIAALYEPYVAVIASTYRHNPRDYDDEGNRILCPRFGSVTCGEHIAIEPILYEKFFDGQRVAPRHIMVELDGEEKFDVFYRNDTFSVFDDIRKGIAERQIQPTTVVRGDRSIVERVASPDIVDRIAVESAYKEGDQALRRSLLDAAKKQASEAPIDLLRLAVLGLDVEMSREARAALARSDSPLATDLISEALRVPMADSDRQVLIEALERLGKTSQKASWLAVVQTGLAGRSSSIDAGSWAKAQQEYEATARVRSLSELTARQQEMARALDEDPENGARCMDLAEASLALAMMARKSIEDDPRSAGALARFMFADARHAALKARELGAEAWRVDTVLALVAYYRGDLNTAYEKAEAAVKATPPGDPSWKAMAVITIFGEGRFKAIKEAAKAGRKWPPEWLTDLDAAYSTLLHHPLATDGQVLWYHEFLVWLGVRYRAGSVLRAGLERFPDSGALHATLRTHILETKGVSALEDVYEEMLGKESHSPSIEWFAGYASIVAADYDRRGRRTEEADAAYARAIAHFDRAIEDRPDVRESADHYAALAWAGRARLSFEDGEDDRAAEEIMKSFRRSPGSAGTKDGVGITPAATAQMLIARLTEQGRDDLVGRIVAALGELDPELLVPDEK